MRLGRSYSQYDLHRPTVVFSPAPPTQQQQQTIATTLTAVSRRVNARRFPPQWYEPNDTIDSAGHAYILPERALGPDPPTIISFPQSGTVQVTIAALRIHARPRPTTHVVRPPAVLPGPPVVTTLSVTSTAVRQRLARLRRGTGYTLAGPVVVFGQQILQIGAPFASLATVRRPVPRAGGQLFPQPPTASTFVAKPVSVTTVRARPRLTRSQLRPLIFYAQTSAITVAQTRARPRKTHALLTSVFYPQTSAIRITLTRARPRPTRHTLGPLIFYPTTSVIRTALVHTRPRPTTKRLTYVVYPQVTPVTETEVAGKTVVDDRRRRQPRSRLQPPVFYPQTSTVSTHLVRTRPRPTTRALGPLIFYPQTSELQVALVRTRPRHTTHTGLSYIVYPATSTLRVAFVRTRPRPTRRILTAVFYPQITPILETEVAVKTVTDDRQHRATRAKLSAPVFIKTTSSIHVTLVRIRPPRTHLALFPPSLAPPPVVTTLAVHTVRTRPRHTLARFTPPIVEPYIRPPDRRLEVPAALTHTRPPRTHALLSPPATLAAARFVTALTIKTVQTRPRPTRHFTLPPVVEPPLRAPDRRLRILTALTRTRPRPTTRFLTAVRYAPVGHIAATLVRTRPRPTRALLLGVVYQPPAVTTIRVKTVVTRPRPTRHVVAPAIFRPQTGAVTTRLVAVKDRVRRAAQFHTAPIITNVPSRRATSPISVTLAVQARRRWYPGRHTLEPPTVVHIPLFPRVAGPPESGWLAYKPQADTLADEPGAGWDAYAPQAGPESDTPEQGWETGKPR